MQQKKIEKKKHDTTSSPSRHRRKLATVLLHTEREREACVERSPGFPRPECYCISYTAHTYPSTPRMHNAATRNARNARTVNFIRPTQRARTLGGNGVVVERVPCWLAVLFATMSRTLFLRVVRRRGGAKACEKCVLNLIPYVRQMGFKKFAYFSSEWWARTTPRVRVCVSMRVRAACLWLLLRVGHVHDVGCVWPHVECELQGRKGGRHMAEATFWCDRFEIYHIYAIVRFEHKCFRNGQTARVVHIHRRFLSAGL